MCRQRLLLNMIGQDEVAEGHKHVNTSKSAARFVASQYRRFRELLLYGVIGVSGAILDFSIYAVLTLLWSVAPWLATIISSSLGSCNNFFWNARYNFQTNDRHAIRFAAFYCVSAMGVVGHASGVYLLHDVLNMGVITSKLLVAVPVVLFQYLMNSRFTFAEAGESR